MTTFGVCYWQAPTLFRVSKFSSVSPSVSPFLPRRSRKPCPLQIHHTHSICQQELFWKSTNLKIDTRTNSSHYFDTYYKNTEIIKVSKNTLYQKVQKVGWSQGNIQASSRIVGRFFWEMNQMLVLGKFSPTKAAPQPAGVLRVLLSPGGGSPDHRLKHKLSNVFFR